MSTRSKLNERSSAKTATSVSARLVSPKSAGTSRRERTIVAPGPTRGAIACEEIIQAAPFVTFPATPVVIEGAVYYHAKSVGEVGNERRPGSGSEPRPSGLARRLPWIRHGAARGGAAHVRPLPGPRRARCHRHAVLPRRLSGVPPLGPHHAVLHAARRRVPPVLDRGAREARRVTGEDLGSRSLALVPLPDPGPLGLFEEPARDALDLPGALAAVRARLPVRVPPRGEAPEGPGARPGRDPRRGLGGLRALPGAPARVLVPRREPSRRAGVDRALRALEPRRQPRRGFRPLVPPFLPPQRAVPLRVGRSDPEL